MFSFSYRPLIFGKIKIWIVKDMFYLCKKVIERNDWWFEIWSLRASPSMTDARCQGFFLYSSILKWCQKTLRNTSIFLGISMAQINQISKNNHVITKFALWISVLMIFYPRPFLSSALSIALPAIHKEFSVNTVYFSWVAASYGFTAATAVKPAGTLI